MFTQHRGKQHVDVKTTMCSMYALKQQRFSRTQVENQKDITIKLSARAKQKCICTLGLLLLSVQ